MNYTFPMSFFLQSSRHVIIQLLFCRPHHSTRYVMIKSPLNQFHWAGSYMCSNRTLQQHNCRLICYCALPFIALERRWYNASLSRESNPLALPKLLTAFLRSSPCKGKRLELEKTVLSLDIHKRLSLHTSLSVPSGWSLSWFHTYIYQISFYKSCYWCYKQSQHT